MQAQIDEAIEKLQSALKQIDEAQPLCPSPGCDILSNAGMNVDLALVKLKEVPEQGEFTKNILANLERWDLLPKEKDCRIRTIIAWLKEVCRRYDWLVERNAKLHTESQEKDRTISQLRQQKTSIISQLNQQINQLHAENKKLIEGQKG